MKSLLYLVVAVLLINSSCKKGIEQDKQYIRGRLFLLDTITQYSNGLPLTGKRIYLSGVTDSVNYLYAAKTDGDGYFNFTLLSNSANTYILTTNDTIKGYLYKAKMEVKRGDQNVVLTEMLDDSLQNGFVLRTTDESGSIIPKTNLSLYNSLTLALQDNTLGAIETFISDSLGKSFKIQLPAGTYFINAKKVIDTATFQKALFQINVPQRGFLYDVIKLNRKIVTHQNGFNIQVVDSLGGLIPKASVFLYNSQVLATANTANGVYDSFTTDNLGRYSKYDFPSGDYYLNVSKVVSDSVTYTSLVNKIPVPANGIINVTIEVKRKR